MTFVRVFYGFALLRICRKPDKKPAEPEFKSPRVARLFDKWRGVWLMAMDRQRKLQAALDRLNEVRPACGVPPA